MKFQSLIISRGSGSVGGLTFSHNKGGQYIRARVTPTDPATAFQNVIRAAAAGLVNFWNDVLTQIERDAWAVYATNTPLLDTFGEPRTVTGLNMYVRGNVSRIQAGLPRQDTAPTLFNLGEFTLVNVAIVAAGQNVSVDFTNTDAWANENDSALLIYVSRPQNPGVAFFKGPYRLAGSIDGDSITAPTTPQSRGVPFPVVAGQRVFTKFRATRADGRLSFIQRASNIVVA